MQVGFAGLGRMGAPMARNLAASGVDLTLWNRTQDKSRALAAELGCATAATPRALSEASDVVVTMLADDPSSEAVHLGPDGLFAGGAGTFLEMGTLGPAHIETLAAAAPDRLIIDAPVSGATQAAADAMLLVMAGCTEDEAREVAPLLAAMGRRTIHLGRRGAGTVMKLAVNSLIHGLNQTLSEAMTLAEAAGITREAAFDVIEDSAAGAPMLRYRRPLYLDEANHEVSFTVALALKDMSVMAELARELGVPTPQGDVTRDRLQQADAQGYGARDMAAMLEYMRKEVKK